MQYIKTLAIPTWLLTLALLTAEPAAAAGKKKRVGQLPEKYRNWLKEVALIIEKKERKAFLELEQDYQRDKFIEAFWRSRDSNPETPFNEYKNDYYARRTEAESRFHGPLDERGKVYVLNGDPDALFETDCGLLLWPIEVWMYDSSDVSPTPFIVLFYQPSGTGPFRMWAPVEGDEVLIAIDLGAQSLEELIYDRCIGSVPPREVIGYIRAAESEGMNGPQRILAAKPVDDEWLLSYQDFLTDVPEGAEPLQATVEVTYPGTYQSRTVLQGVLKVPVEEAETDTVGEFTAYHFQLTGDVMKGEELFETFRYRFELPATEVAGEAELPLLFERYLRPAEYSLILKLEDLNSKRYFRKVEFVEVPKLEAVEASGAVASTEPVELDPVIEIIEPKDEILTGPMRFEALVRGEAIRKVSFALDGKNLLTKTRPPYSVDLALGHVPRSHTLRVTGIDEAGEVVASDELLINAGQHHFGVEIVEPRPDDPLAASTRVRAEVRVPDGKLLDRVELYVDDQRVATLYDEPYTQPVRLADPTQLVVMRAVAFLEDGNSVEDLVLLNAPGIMEETDVRMVELYTTVIGSGGRPKSDLGRADFRILENDVEQAIVRFDRLENLPIHVALMLDTSASMEKSLPEVREAALGFLEATVTPKDRAAIITFSEAPQLATKLTNDHEALARGLAGLKAERSTALYDSLVFSLFYLKGIQGQRVILVLSDGEDRRSEHSFGEMLEAAVREGVTVYAIGLNLKKGSNGRGHLNKLAGQTGGRSFYIKGVDELDAIYAEIQAELRSQYLLAYQSSHGGGDTGFRTVEVKVATGGEARTLRGYYP